MTSKIHIDQYNGALGNEQKKFCTDCETQWYEFEDKARIGTTLLLFVRALSTVLGGEAQTVWRQFMERDQQLRAGHPEAAYRTQDIEACKAWKQY